MNPAEDGSGLRKIRLAWRSIGLGCCAALALRVAPVRAAGSAAETNVAAIVLARMKRDLLRSADHARPDAVAGRRMSIKRLLRVQRRDGSWPDIAYASRAPSLWPPIEHLRRVLALAVDAAARRDANARAGAVRGLEYWLRLDPKSSNWWWNTIGMEQQLASILVVLRDGLPPADLRAGCRLLRRSRVEGFTGTNLAWEAANLFTLGALTDDVPLMRRMLGYIAGDIRITTAEGIQPDWSFHQHGPQLNAGNYGLGFLETCARYAEYVRGTTLQVSAAGISRLDRFALNFQDWVVWGRRMDLSSCGRQLDLPNSQERKAEALADDFRRLLALGPADPRPIETLIARVAGRLPPGADAPAGNRYYWRSDFMVHRPGSWYASIKMYSPRVLRTETWVNAEDLKGYHLSDGATFLMIRGDEYDNIQPVWDWRKLPGVTFRAASGPLPYRKRAPALYNP
ncbi:MAG: polysaccharide lyase family 8 super-sandwich domain-containing protein, partial [Opitutaceae bacterium]